jgi:hypothetical protein
VKRADDLPTVAISDAVRQEAWSRLWSWLLRQPGGEQLQRVDEVTPTAFTPAKPAAGVNNNDINEPGGHRNVNR